MIIKYVLLYQLASQAPPSFLQATGEVRSKCIDGWAENTSNYSTLLIVGWWDKHVSASNVAQIRGLEPHKLKVSVGVSSASCGCTY